MSMSVSSMIGDDLPVRRTSPSPSEESALASVAPEEIFDREDTMSQSYESGITLEDPEVRLAAEVLGTLHRSGAVPPPPPHPTAFLDRVSEYPIVSTAVRAYENGKSNSKGFKYAAQTIESVAIPVVRKLEPLDDFACRQLDRIEGKAPLSTDLEAQTSSSKRKLPSSEDEVMHDAPPRSQRASKWQEVFTGASGLTLSLSEDSIKSLRYCVEWLQWANTHVGGLLRGLCRYAPHGQVCHMSQSDRTALLNHITHARREIADTLKKLVAIVSNYAGTALPEPARSRIRGLVLGMPGRWAARQSDNAPPYPAEKMNESEEIEREFSSVTSLASESLEVLHNVSETVLRTLEKTQDWVNWRQNKAQPPPYASPSVHEQQQQQQEQQQQQQQQQQHRSIHSPALFH